MTKIAKRIAKNMEGIDRAKVYSLAEAVKLVKARANAKFNETIEVAMNLGVDPRHSDQMVRGVVNLPNGTGRSVRVGVFAKGHIAEGFRRLFLGGLTPWTENQQSIDALYDRGAELRRLEQSKEWIAENGIDAEEPDMHEQKVIAYTMRMLSAIGRDNKGFTKEERAAHDRLRIGTARAALNKDPLPLYPDAFSKDTDLPSKALEEKRDEFLVSFVRALSSNKPTSLTAREKEAGKSLDDKVRRWEADRALAVAFLKKKGYSRDDAVNLYKKRYGKEVGREAIRNSTHRILKSFTDSEDTQTQTSS